MINTILLSIAVFLLVAFFVAPFVVDFYYRKFKDDKIRKDIKEMLKKS